MLYAYDSEYKNGKYSYAVLDEDDMSVERVSEDDCKAFSQVSDLLSMDYADLDNYDFAIGVAKSAYLVVQCTNKRLGRYKMSVRGVGGVLFNEVTVNADKGRLYIDYLTLSVEVLDNRFFVVGFDGMDKHYYREDREEYFRKSVIFDCKGRKVFETGFEIAEYANYFGIVNGHLHENCIVRGDGKVLEEGKRIC